MCEVSYPGSTGRCDLQRVRLETAGTRVLRERLGSVANTRKACQTDRSDAEWFYVEPQIIYLQSHRTPKVIQCVRTSTPSSNCAFSLMSANGTEYHWKAVYGGDSTPDPVTTDCTENLTLTIAN